MVARIAKPAARWIGVALLLLGIAGFFDTPLIGRHGLIGADEGISIGHAAVGLLLLLASLGGESTCAFSLYVAAAVFVIFAGYVLWELGPYDTIRFSSLVATRSAEYFHLALAVPMVVLGKMNTARQQLFRE